MAKHTEMPPQTVGAAPGSTLDVCEMLARGAHAGGPRVLLRDQGGNRTGVQLLDRVPRIAAQLAQLNGARGHVVVIDAAPSIATVEAYWATLHAGLVPLLVRRDWRAEQISPALSGLALRGGIAADREGVSRLGQLGVDAGLAAFPADNELLPTGWTPVLPDMPAMRAPEAGCDEQLCAFSFGCGSDGQAVIAARSHRAVALTGLIGQFLLAPGEGEVLVAGDLGGAVLEWILHCAVMARVPTTLGGAQPRPTAGGSWQLAVATSDAAASLLLRTNTDRIAAARTAVLHDCTFGQPGEPQDSPADLELSVCDLSGFLFSRQERAAAGWFATPFAELADPSSHTLPARTLEDALLVKLRTPQAGSAHTGASLTPGSRLPAGAPADIGTLLRSAAAQRPESPALIQDGVTLTYGQFTRRAAQLSAVLRDQYGVKTGDRVAFLALNRPEFFETYLAAVQLGAIFTPLNFRLSGSEVRAVLSDCTPRVLIAESELTSAFSESVDWLPSAVQLLPISRQGTRPCAYNEKLEQAEPLTKFVRGADEAASSILYTTGTTGTPKGAVRSHKSITWFSLIFSPPSLREDPDATHLATPPLFHIAGHETALLPALGLGRKVVIQRRFDADKMLAEIEQYRVTSAFSPPTVAIELAQRLRARPVDLSSLRDWSSGSAPLSVESRDVICAAAPRLRFRNSLGMTEGGGIAALQGARLFEKPATCVGQVAAGVEVRIAELDGTVLPALATGEIQVRSPQLLSHYWNRPEATVAAFEGGWFHTGDLGLFDADGDLHIVGRLKDMIITGGENVYAAEVERALLNVPGVAETAVVGVPDPKWGESVVAWIVRKPGSLLTEADVVAQCRKQIAHYKCPRHCVFTDSLPRNAIGKVQKQQLRQNWSGHSHVTAGGPARAAASR